MKKITRIASMLSILLAGAMVAPLPAYGRIGETPEQCKQRYGEPVRGGSDVIRIMEEAFEGMTHDPQVMSLDFQKGGLDISVTFFKGKAAEIVYHKNGAFGQGEINTLLTLNSGGRQWDIVNSYTFLVNSNEKKKWFEKQKKVPVSQVKWQSSIINSSRDLLPTSSPQDHQPNVLLTADCLERESGSTLTITTDELLANIETRKKASQNKHLEGF